MRMEMRHKRKTKNMVMGQGGTYIKSMNSHCDKHTNITMDYYSDIMMKTKCKNE